MTETPDWPARIIAWGKFPSLLTGQWARDGVRHYTDETRAYVPEAALAASEERARRAEEEVERLRDALQAVVEEYPIAAGITPLMDPEVAGYGSIKAARIALATPMDEEA